MKPCCGNCYGRMGTLAGGGTYCSDTACPCHTNKIDEADSAEITSDNGHHLFDKTDEALVGKWLEDSGEAYLIKERSGGKVVLDGHYDLGELVSRARADEREKAEKAISETLLYDAGYKRGCNDQSRITIEKIAEKLLEIEKEKWDDAVHCTCLGYAIVTIFGDKYEKKIKELKDSNKK